MKYKRVLLKLSGEALGSKYSILDKDILENLLEQIKILKEEYDVEVAIVVGGGNIFRGEISDKLGMGTDTAAADYMGMMATTINALGLMTFFNNKNLKTVMQNSLKFEKISDGINSTEAIKELGKKNVVIFGGGTGEPYLSTDTAAAMRAIEINADVILMAKNGVDGVYDADPKFNLNSKFISKLTFDEVINQKLKVVDLESMKLLNGKKIDVLLFNMNVTNNIINLYKDFSKVKKTIISEE